MATIIFLHNDTEYAITYDTKAGDLLINNRRESLAEPFATFACMYDSYLPGEIETKYHTILDWFLEEFLTAFRADWAKSQAKTLVTIAMYNGARCDLAARRLTLASGDILEFEGTNWQLRELVIEV